MIGFILSNFMFKEYGDLKTLGKDDIYFLQSGIYNSKEELEKDNMNKDKYIVEENNGTYYAYLAVTTDKDNYNKLKKYFQSKNYDVISKEKEVSNSEFVKALEKYDLLLKEAKDDNTITLINDQVIDKYKEYIING